MARTTLNIDASVLRELKERSRAEHKSAGELASELLAAALHRDRTEIEPPKPFVMPTYDMGVPLVDLDDKEAVRLALEGEHHR